MRSATGTVVYNVQDGVTTSVSTDRVTMVPTGHRALQSSAENSDEAVSGATATEAATGVGATAWSFGETGLGKKYEEEYVIDKPVEYRSTEMGMEYCARWYGYDPLGDISEPSE